MNILGNFLRVNCGRSTVVKLQNHMTERNKQLANQFTVKNVTQTEYVTNEDACEEDSKKKRKKDTRQVEILVVYANNVEELVALTMKERGLTPESSIVQVRTN